MWTSEQRKRLAYEKSLLRKFNMEDDFFFANPTDNTACELIGNICTSYGKIYNIRFRIAGFPYRCPEAYIISPIMYDYQGKMLIDYGTSHAMHLLSPNNNEVHLCLFKSDYWSPNNTLVMLILKAKLWLEAYEQHLQTGKDIDCFVNSY